MKKITSKFVAVLLALSLLITGMPARTFAATTAEPKSADEVVYVKSGKYVYNWGKRGTVATFLTTYAENYYTGSYAYDNLAGLAGSNVAGTAFYSSALGTAIHNLLVAKQTSTTSYDQVKTLLKYTESQQSNTTKLTTFYTAQEISNVWDGGATWNREHTWPNSKGLNGQDENDVLMLKPENSSDNSSRGNTAYGEGGSYFNPNKAAGQNLHGDVARLLLQHLMRWGNTAKFYGYDGVIESRAVLLKWLAEDPVDTWEMGRNDAVQSITGIRNIFVDYPELAFKLLGEDVPDGYITPSGSESVNYTITVLVNNAAYGTASVNGRTITAVPASGYYVKSASVTNGTGTTSVDGNTIRVSASSDCTVTVNFAPITYATLTYVINGETFNTLSVQTGTKVTLPTVSASAFAGYSFLGWATEEMTDALTKPTLYTTEYTPTADTTLYAVFSRMEEGGSTAVSQFVLVKDMSQLTAGAEVVIVAADYNVAMAHAYQQNKCFSQTAVTKGVETLADYDADAIAILTLGAGTTTGTWSFYEPQNGGYLAAVDYIAGGTSTASNAMLTEETLSANSSFTIALADGKATLESKTGLAWNLIRYNSAYSRFSCYKPTSGDVAEVALYVKTGAFTTFYTTNPGADLEYTVTAASNDTAKGTVSVVGYSVVCEPADGYEVAEVSVTSGTATWKLDGNIITVTPASDCEITVTFAEKQAPPFKYQENTPYRFGMVQKGISGSPTLYFTGAKSGNFFATTQTESAAADVYLEAVSGGYRLYFMNGSTKTYLEIYEYTAGKVGIDLLTTPSAVYTYNETYDIFVANVLGTDYTFGTYGTFDTISKIDQRYFEKIATDEEFPARLTPSSTPTPPEPETARITYVVNGVTATSGDFAVGTTVTLAEPSTSFEGFTYVGWSTVEIETPAATADVLLRHTVTADATLYALFISNTTGTYTTRPAVAPPISYKVTYVANGKAMGSQSAASGSSLKLLTVVPSVTNYKLAGWSTSEITSEVTSVASLLTGSYTPTADVTLYAVYQNKTTNGYTTVPGSETVTYILGDVNKDGVVTDADVIYLLYYTFYPEDYPINQPADFNGDGVVTDADVIYLLYYTFYPEDYPLE